MRLYQTAIRALRPDPAPLPAIPPEVAEDPRWQRGSPAARASLLPFVLAGLSLDQMQRLLRCRTVLVAGVADGRPDADGTHERPFDRRTYARLAFERFRVKPVSRDLRNRVVEPTRQFVASEAVLT